MAELTGLQPGLLQMGPANIYYGSGAINLGFCDNVKIKIDKKLTEMKGGQYGDTPVDHRVSAFDAMISADLQQVTLEMLQRAMLGVTQSFVDDTTSTKRRLEFQARVGQGMRALATIILIKPIDGGAETTDKERWIQGDLCVPISAVELGYKATEQQKISTEWFAYSDPSKRGRALFMGDDTAIDTTTPFGF
jgi:hypothetical protein